MALTTQLPQAGAELIAVSLGAQKFAIDIMSVREIRGWTTSTPLPQAPSYVLGMINLRGAVLPVIDLGAKLGFGNTNPQRSSVVVVVQGGGQQVGLLVDAVCDILTVGQNSVQDVPEVGAGAVHDAVLGVMTIDDEIVSILALDHVLGEAGRIAA
ncbi:chemotaxis protein CheW [Lutibaculum baratangense]|uniref:Positive regulator of CheA protein activity (CheW) n=1 Tax=Lutibaculum baratangense AMV1 TaxID=631454 RepID=V4RPN7_9HYPH|nr:chemotaxis protein CheW [Lutibaculum baratangense]ESR25160.1 Positive regulator of CheA protein activity (CheW) [Lutibaculum baratangense AMV1]